MLGAPTSPAAGKSMAPRKEGFPLTPALGSLRAVSGWSQLALIAGGCAFPCISAQCAVGGRADLTAGGNLQFKDGSTVPTTTHIKNLGSMIA